MAFDHKGKKGERYNHQSDFPRKRSLGITVDKVRGGALLNRPAVKERENSV